MFNLYFLSKEKNYEALGRGVMEPKLSFFNSIQIFMRNKTERQKWREFHYGMPHQKPTAWMLTDYGQKMIHGNYALCVWKQKQLTALGGNHKFKIEPSP